MTTHYRTTDDTTTIPSAPYYVTADDTFMSGWGEAEGLTNTVILPCDSYDEAVIVSDNAEARSDMTNVQIVTEIPDVGDNTLLTVMTRDDAARWYQEGGF